MNSDMEKTLAIIKIASDGESIPFMIKQIKDRADAEAAHCLAVWLKYNQSAPNVTRVDIRDCIAQLARVALERGEDEWMVRFAIDFRYLPSDVREEIRRRVRQSNRQPWVGMLEDHIHRRVPLPF